MTEALAILDTDVAVLILDNRKNRDVETFTRRERAMSAIDDLRKKGARCLVTTPTVVELASWKGGSPQALVRLRQFLAGLRVSGLTIGSARAAGDILLERLKPRPIGKGRNEIKFDALIAGIAHASEARWLVTGNAKDYLPLLKEIESSVHVIDIDAPPPKGQLSLAQAIPKVAT